MTPHWFHLQVYKEMFIKFYWYEYRCTCRRGFLPFNSQLKTHFYQSYLENVKIKSYQKVDMIFICNSGGKKLCTSIIKICDWFVLYQVGIWFYCTLIRRLLVRIPLKSILCSTQKSFKHWEVLLLLFKHWEWLLFDRLYAAQHWPTGLQHWMLAHKGTSLQSAQPVSWHFNWVVVCCSCLLFVRGEV